MSVRSSRHAYSDDDLSAYVDAALSERDAGRLEEHLSSCAACQGQVEELRALKSAVRALPAASAPRSFAVEAPQGSPAMAPRRYSFLGGLAAASLVLLVGVVSYDAATISDDDSTASSPTSFEQAADSKTSGAGGAMSMSDAAGGRPETSGERSAATQGAAPAAAPNEAATRAAAPAAPPNEAATVAPQLQPAADQRQPASPLLEDNDDRTGLRVAEAALAVALIASAGGWLYLRRRAA